MQDILAVIRRDRLIHIIIVGMLIYTYAVSMVFDFNFKISAKSFMGDIVAVEGLTLFALLCAFIFQLWRAGNKSPTLAIIAKVRDILKDPAELIGFLAVNIALIAFISGFSFIKSMIPAINPFAFDQAFTKFDRALHFGVDPWKITHAIFNGPIATAAINFLYNLWFFLFWGVTFFFVLRTKKPKDREQYLVSYFLCWLIIGGLFATLMSSVGPVFYGNLVVGPNPFAPLMDTLNAQNEWLVAQDSPVKVWSLGVADMLWERYAASETGLGSGISAMPSMHVSMAVLMALGVGRISKIWGRIFWGYALIIQIGSVHLAWHYAIDGYFSIIATVLIWHGVGKVVALNQKSLKATESLEVPTAQLS